MSTKSIPACCWEVFRLAIPNIVSFLLLIGGQLIVLQTLIAKKDYKAVAGVGCGNFIFSIFGLAVGLGLSGALDTLVSQAIGKKDLKSASLNLSQARTVTFLAIIPSICLLLCASPVLSIKALKQPTDMLERSDLYNKIQFAGILQLFWSCALGCFLRAMNKTKAPLIANILGAAIQSGLGIFILGFYNHWDEKSVSVDELNTRAVKYASWIAVLANTVRWIYLEIYIVSSLPEEEKNIASLMSFMKNLVTDFTKIFEGLYQFVSLALPSCLMMWSEWFAAEVQVLVAAFGAGGGPYASANITLASYSVFVFMLPVGICNTTSYLIGSKISQGDNKQAKKYAVSSLTLTIVLMLIAVSVVFLCKDLLIRRDMDISKDEGNKDIEITENEIRNAFPYLCIFMLIDGIQNVVEGILRGLGKQKNAVWIKLFAMLGIRFILGMIFFHKLKLYSAGLWIAASIGMLVSLSSYAYILAKSSFSQKETNNSNSPNTQTEPNTTAVMQS
jgi:multidrug resistance protein, MATE family